jgi:hypothetical protein
VIANPSQLVLEQYRERQAVMLRARKKLNKLKKTPAITLCGTTIALMANIELPDDCAAALEAGAVGVGLFRSEFLFMGRGQKMPSEEEQFEAYKKTVTAMKGRPVTIRTLDIGADKPLDQTDHTALNPALGLRAIRYCLAEPQLFLTQLRAILRASAFGKVRILIPMLAHAFEIDQSLAMIEQAKVQLHQANIKYDPHVPVGAMIEIPAAALALPMFVKGWHRGRRLRRDGRRRQADPLAAGDGLARILDAPGAVAVGQARDPRQRSGPHRATDAQNFAHHGARCDHRSRSPVAGDVILMECKSRPGLAHPLCAVAALFLHHRSSTDALRQQPFIYQ